MIPNVTSTWSSSRSSSEVEQDVEHENVEQDVVNVEQDVVNVAQDVVSVEQVVVNVEQVVTVEQVVNVLQLVPPQPTRDAQHCNHWPSVRALHP